MDNADEVAQMAAFLRDIYGDDSVSTPTAYASQMPPHSEMPWDAADSPVLADLDVLELFNAPGSLDMLDAAFGTDSSKNACTGGTFYEQTDTSASDTQSLSSYSSCDAIESAQILPRRKNNGGGNAARKRQRQEIHALREEAVLLEEKVEKLTVKKKIREMHASGSPNLLKFVARDGAREDGEKDIERTRLQRLVKEHDLLTQQFQATLRSYPSLSVSEIMADSGALWHGIQTVRASPSLECDERVFELLARNIDERYHQVRQVFKDVGLKDSQVGICDARVDTNGDGFSFARFKASQVMPFSVDMINEAAKHASTEAFKHELIYKRSSRSIALKKQLVMGDATITVRTVSKRYHENDRTTVVTDTVSEWMSASSGQIVTIEVKGWVVVKPYPIAKKKSTQPLSGASLFQACSFMTPVPSVAMSQMPMNTSHHNADVTLLSNVVLPSYEQIHIAHLQRLENVLLEHSLQQRVRV
ncbi:hypothetical protein FI667_g11887, partial [Globisporangium splendens]